MGHARAFFGPVGSTIEFCYLIGVRFPGSAIKGGEFGDQLGDGQTEFGCSGLEHIRSVLVDLDADVAVHGTRIADSEAADSNACVPNAVRFPYAVVTIADCKLLTGWGEVVLSPNFASWNQVSSWLQAVDGLRNAA
jgi:hypothetical protein